MESTSNKIDINEMSVDNDNAAPIIITELMEPAPSTYVPVFDWVGMFEKVSFEQFKKGIERFKKNNNCLDIISELRDDELKTAYYDNIKLPDRSTVGSAGYDFYFPFDQYLLRPGESITIPTGIRVFIRGTFFLGIFPKSGLSFDFKVRLDDTVAIVDADYYEADNEGHIYLKITNENTERAVLLKHNMKIVQGVFIPFGLAKDDNTTTVRTGGMGHSDNSIKLNSTV